MMEPEALQKRRKFLFEQLAKAADEIKLIDERLSALLEGRRPGTGD